MTTPATERAAPSAPVRRPLSRWASAWLDLIDGADGGRVLVVGPADGPSARALADRGARAVFVGANELGETSMRIERRGWDLVIVNGALSGLRHRRGLLERAASSMAPGGRLVIVADNARSPLRLVDRLAGRPAAQTGPRLQQVERDLGTMGLHVHQRFGLLRSSATAVTDFDLDARCAADGVLQAAATRTDPARAAGLWVLRRLMSCGCAAAAVPAWMVIASSRPPALDALRPTGRLGYEDSQEAKVLRGEPPVALEKWYSSAAAAQREVMALSALHAARVGCVPRLLGRPAPDRVCLTWLPGRPLLPHTLAPDQISTWSARAARVLADLHRSTALPDGSVLLHGDFWLGNVLVDGDRIVGVIDWSGARRGAGEEDLQHLVDSAIASRMLPVGRRQALTRSVRAAYTAPRHAARD